MALVQFPPDVGAELTSDGNLSFTVLVDGTELRATISKEALHDIERVPSGARVDLMEAFNKHRSVIEAVGQRILPSLHAHGQALLLRTDYFQ